LQKDWRMDRSLRRFEAMLIVADKKKRFYSLWCGRCRSEPDEGITAIGSGAPYAISGRSCFEAQHAK
jgi:ATP-dependent HslUV protease subunit HslV